MRSTKTDINEKKALHRAFLRFLPIPIVLIVLSSLLISYNYFTVRRHTLMHEQLDTIVEAMIDYRDQVSAMTSIVRTIESDYLSLAAVQAPQTEYETLFMNNMLKYPNIDKLRILDLSGMEIIV